MVVKEEGFGFENIFGELAKTKEVENSYRDYHYQMGLVCKEMGWTDEAIKQFNMALEKEQRSAEAAKLLDQCLMEKSCQEESSQSSGLALRAFQKPIPQL